MPRRQLPPVPFPPPPAKPPIVLLPVVRPLLPPTPLPLLKKVPTAKTSTTSSHFCSPPFVHGAGRLCPCCHYSRTCRQNGNTRSQRQTAYCHAGPSSHAYDDAYSSHSGSRRPASIAYSRARCSYFYGGFGRSSNTASFFTVARRSSLSSIARNNCTGIGSSTINAYAYRHSE